MSSIGKISSHFMKRDAYLKVFIPPLNAIPVTILKKHGLHLVNKVQKNGKINISPRKMISALSASLNYQTCSFFYGKHSNWY